MNEQLSHDRQALRTLPPAPVSITEGLLTVLRYLYVIGTDSGRVRFSIADRKYKGHRETLKRAAQAGLVHRTVKPDRSVFWTLTHDGKRLLRVGEHAVGQT